MIFVQSLVGPPRKTARWIAPRALLFSFHESQVPVARITVNDKADYSSLPVALELHRPHERDGGAEVVAPEPCQWYRPVPSVLHFK